MKEWVINSKKVRGSWGLVSSLRIAGGDRNKHEILNGIHIGIWAWRDDKAVSFHQKSNDKHTRTVKIRYNYVGREKVTVLKF